MNVIPKQLKSLVSSSTRFNYLLKVKYIFRLSGKQVKHMDTLQRYSDRFKCFVMLISVSLYDLFLQVQLGAALCLMATPHLERTRSNYTAHVVCLQQFSEWVLLDTILLIFLSTHWAGVGKWIEVTSPFTAGLQWLLLNWRRLSLVTA